MRKGSFGIGIAPLVTAALSCYDPHTFQGLTEAAHDPRCFLAWVQSQELRHEFDGFEPVAMTGGTIDHSRIIGNVQAALHNRLRGRRCEPLGRDAGIATIGDAVRYPDALVTCTRQAGTSLLVSDVVVVFEVLSPSSGRNDRIDKLREYQAAPSIRRYVIQEHASPVLTVFEREAGVHAWTASSLVADDMLRMPEIGIEIAVVDFYEGVEFVAAEEITGKPGVKMP